MAGKAGGNRLPRQRTCFALIGRHTHGGVTLEMFAVTEPFLHRQRQVTVGDVILQINKGLAAHPLRPPQRFHPTAVVAGSGQ